ncbi:recombination-associated protein RdgC [Nitrosomonas mobilis]|uniref:Recombination-associated protein RdgC n=1 Tax=Nitrosomonas mobilis TaxID=51642 RepID=A0A1G5SB47_9PROT|nr:recombination-associated protein RdgC [Nitrosomonas mobilis]SCZ84217.1 Recombination-associated protein RdgC [Nitrosomonas mobilis]HNO76150.1 recombination-associated protein RdgC [Nitrosomonas mobilis]
MWFKNLQIYRVNGWQITSAELEALLSKRTLQTCTSMEIQSIGWVPPGIEETSLVYARGDQLLIALGIEKKLLPASVVNQLANVRKQEMEARQGYAPGRKQLKDIKEAAYYELLSRAFAVRQKIHVWIDPVDGWFVIDNANIAKADTLTEAFLKSASAITLRRVDTTMAPTSAMTGWLSGDVLPQVFSIDADSVFRSRNDKKVSISYHQQPLDEQDITRHVRDGKEVTRLALTWQDKISFMLDENLLIKRLTLQDIEKEPVDSAQDRFDSDFHLMTAELKLLLPDLLDALGGETIA